MARLTVVGIGPGGAGGFTSDAVEALRMSEVIVGYTPYLEYVMDTVDTSEKKLYGSGMMKEMERCEYAVKSAAGGVVTAIVSTGDAGLYGMAGPVFELAEQMGYTDEIEIEVVPGVSAVFAAASILGAPLMHDTALISLSDLMTPWETITKRVEAAAMADFVIALYNPRSKKRTDQLPTAIELIRRHRGPDTPVGIVRNAGREGEWYTITTIDRIDYDEVDMMSVLIIGNSTTRIVRGRMVTPRGYEGK